jgi:hypothetical protein
MIREPIIGRPIPAGRLGFFEFAACLVEARAPEVTRVMGACAILSARGFAPQGVYRYLATARQFRPVSEGALIPFYVWFFDAGGAMWAVERDRADWPGAGPWGGLH